MAAQAGTGLGAETPAEAVEKILTKIREQLFARGVTGMRGIGRFFERADFNGNKKLDAREFDDVASLIGIFMSKQETSMLFRHLDRSGDGSIDYDEFLRALAGGLNERRKALVQKAWELIDRDGSGTLTVADLEGIYNASQHPDVREGRKTEEEVLTEFLSSFEGSGAAGAGTAGDGTVSKTEFFDYYTDLSSSIPTDAYFATMMESSWGISENETAELKAICDRFELMLVTKAEQKAKTKGGSGRYDVMCAFNHFDKDESGAVTRQEFASACQLFGIPLERRQINALFSRYDPDGSGTITTAEFCEKVFGAEL